MKLQTILLAASVALIGGAAGTPTSSQKSTSKSSSVSTKHSTTASSKTSTKSSSTSSKSTTSSSKSATASATSVSKTFDINFDERTVVPALPLLNAVGLEDTILFNSWVLNNPVSVGGNSVGVNAHSPPNFIVTANEQQLTNGTPSLTILYPGSKIKSYDLHSFFLGCALNTAEGEVGAASQCTVTVAGFRNGQEVAVASFTFTPTVGMVSAPMIQAVLPGNFVNLQNVTIIENNPTANALLTDDYLVTTHT